MPAVATKKKPAVKKAVAAVVAALTITLPKLAKGEIYAGILLVDGKPDHHVVLLPGDTSLTWDKAVAWAKKQGGELPTRKEQALLFANAAAAFQERWYWSVEHHASFESCAWMQIFSGGNQYFSHKVNDYRARAVRRVAI